MISLSDPHAVQALLRRHGFHFSKAMGQNFIVDSTVCPRMAAQCGADGETGVLEIGPGIGVLTRELSFVAKKVVAVELDTRLLPVLRETLGDRDNVTVHNGDIMKTDVGALLAQEFPGMRVVVCANLPYYITSPIVMKLLEEHLPISALTVMVQKEAAERLCAAPGNRACGAVSAAVRYYSVPEILFQVGRESFLPPPNVDSAVIRLNIPETPPYRVKDEAVFFKTVQAAFAQRRKTVLNSLAASLGLPKAEVQGLLEEAGVAAGARAEQLTMDELVRLADALAGRLPAVKGKDNNETI